ncbi:uncharacterized protein LOC111872356 isoform X2 [Cryptotermes secundus]|uniref:uncharacterized protein LOC111872356 isoform X2 n=1 Tax=Cryptotermes secundus TaxID=105785 RepID=UPI001454C053|nr:uncharacterized protein LOC111872356 isoform X2 [Cryptotermes secundus]
MCHQLVVYATGPPPRGRRHNLNRFLVFLLMCCCYCTAVVEPLLQLEEPELLLQRREAADQQDYYRDDDEHSTINEEEEEETNTTELGSFLGAPCHLTCDPELPHVFCDQITGHCECEKKYPVKLGAKTGCAKPVRLGDQCFYRQTCEFTDQHATCIQVNHNAICQCEPGYHTVALQRPTKKVFCSADLVILTTDVPTLFGVATGLAIFTALICFVLKLFSRARYSRPRHYANANLAPPILFSSETGSRRPSVASIHSSTSSSRSYSARRFERENMQREQRQLQLQMQMQIQRDNLKPAAVPTPSPKTPVSTDELLPSVSEVREESHHSTPTVNNVSSSSNSSKNGAATSYLGEIGPCSSTDLPPLG